ncbi:magnesium transporter [Pseudaminobacter sp. 19-2017]|uniref:Magnesium transporter MgtE n=1 Tax=Pseudaminobacter soli (ex Zhang et al. 2022) TaxID=2831468 RepID=A0A942E2Y2_9HYPH|nr:magnesium transporter [Pseudaminobacter soli]MBS3652531.1 magnesium transporter [Pseudaminobacter soli]
MPEDRTRRPDRGQLGFLEDSASAHVGDVVALLNESPRRRAAEMLADFPVEQAVEVFDKPELKHAAELIQLLPARQAAAVLGEMSPDRATDVLQNLGASERARLLGLLSRNGQAKLRTLLSYPRDTAGGLMTTEFVSVPSTSTVGDTLQHIRKIERASETIYAIYVLDSDSERLLRTASLRRLISGEPKAPILSICPDRDPIVVMPTTDREDVTRLIAKHDLLAIPVVDESGRVLGIVTFDDVIDAMIEEGTEDVHKLGGLDTLDRPYTDIGFFQMIRKRGGWLAVLFMGEMLTASAMQHFEADIAKAVVLTLFIPLIISSGGNSGSQAASLIVRALALQELRLGEWWRVALRELPTGIALGAILGAIGVARIALWQHAGFFDYGEHWVLVALTVGVSLVGVVAFGSLAGAILPFALKALRFDPASASAPFVATLVDVSGIVIYFSIALLILGGKLL